VSAGFVALVVGAVALFGMARSEAPGPLEAFYAEIAVQVDVGPDDPLADLRGPSRSSIRWWYAPDPNRWRWEVETVAPSLDAGTAITVFDGDEMWSTEAHTTNYRRHGTPMEVVLSPTFSAPVGPANVASMDAFLSHWRGANESVEVVGEETILGRRTEVVEMRPAWHSSSSSATASGSEGEAGSTSTPTSSASSGGVVRAYIDPERMFIMRWEVDGEGAGQSYRAEVVRLDYGVDVDETQFVFAPPADATELTDGNGSCTSSSGLQDGRTIQVPPGFLRPVALPDGFRATGAGSQGEAGGCDAVAAWALLEDDAGRRILLEQRRRPDIPPALRTGSEVELGDGPAFRGRDGNVERVVWQQAGMVALLRGDGVPFETLFGLAQSSEVNATAETGRTEPTPPPPGAFDGCPDPAAATAPEATVVAFIEALQIAAQTNGYCAIRAHAVIDPAEWERFMAPRAGGDSALFQMVGLYLSGPIGWDLPPESFTVEGVDQAGDEATVTVDLHYAGGGATDDGQRTLRLRPAAGGWLISAIESSGGG